MEILVKDLKVFAAFNEELFKEITQLLTLENFRYGWISINDRYVVFTLYMQHFLAIQLTSIYWQR